MDKDDSFYDSNSESKEEPMDESSLSEEEQMDDHDHVASMESSPQV